jgi:hypothetical protein
VNEEAKTRYRAVKIQPQWVVTPGKQTTNIPVCSMTTGEYYKGITLQVMRFDCNYVEFLLNDMRV